MEDIPINDIKTGSDFEREQPEGNFIAEMDARYIERKALIKKKDEELYAPILKVIEGSQSNTADESTHGVNVETSMAHVSGEELTSNVLSGRYMSDEGRNASLLFTLANGFSLINIGSGGRDNNLMFASKIGNMLLVKDQDLVDPFFEQSKVKADIARLGEEHKIRANNLRFVQNDALKELCGREDISGNVFISTVNTTNIYASIGRDNMHEWLSRVAQESYRVIPKNGILICVDSDDVAAEAEKIFENRTKLAIGFDVFIKGDSLELLLNLLERSHRICRDLLLIIDEIEIALNKDEVLFFKDLIRLAKELIKNKNEMSSTPYMALLMIRDQINELDHELKNELDSLDKKKVFVKKMSETFEKYPVQVS